MARAKAGRLPYSQQRSKRRTVGLRCIPEHHTAERGVLAARLERDVRERAGVDVSGGGGSARGRGPNIDLDVRVDRDGLRPVVPEAEVPRVRIVEVGQPAVVVVEQDVDGVEGYSVEDPRDRMTSY